MQTLKWYRFLRQRLPQQQQLNKHVSHKCSSTTAGEISALTFKIRFCDMFRFHSLTKTTGRGKKHLVWKAFQPFPQSKLVFWTRSKSRLTEGDFLFVIPASNCIYLGNLVCLFCCSHRLLWHACILPWNWPVSRPHTLSGKIESPSWRRDHENIFWKLIFS